MDNNYMKAFWNLLKGHFKSIGKNRTETMNDSSGSTFSSRAVR